MPTTLSADEFSTATMTTPEVDATTQATPTDALAAAAPTTPATQQAAPMYTPTEAVQPTPYSGVQPQPGAPTVFAAAQPGQPLPAQGGYAQYATQPGQPGLPYPGQPGAPVAVAKRRRPLLWVAIVVIALLLVGGGTAFAIVSQMPTNTPTQVMQQYCHGFTTLNAQEVYNTFSAESQKRESLSQVKQSFDMLKGFGSMVTFHCAVNDVQQSGSTNASGKANLTYVVSLMGISVNGSISESLSLVLENRAWKIDVVSADSPNITMPTMPVMPTFPPDILTPTPSN